MSKTTAVRHDKFIKERRHDVYQIEEKLPESTRCPECGVEIKNGHWSWPKPPEKVQEVRCPACKRVADNAPAGFIEIRGSFFKENRDEILHMIMNIEKAEKADRPLERVIEITDEHDHVRVTTTGVHIARRIGEALSRSYKGEYSFQYGEGEQIIRVYWTR